MQEVSSLSSQILPVSISLSPHHASATFDTGELGVVHARLNSGDAQPFVVIDGSVLVVLALLGPKRVVPAGDR